MRRLTSSWLAAALFCPFTLSQIVIEKCDQNPTQTRKGSEGDDTFIRPILRRVLSLNLPHTRERWGQERSRGYSRDLRAQRRQGADASCLDTAGGRGVCDKRHVNVADKRGSHAPAAVSTNAPDTSNQPMHAAQSRHLDNAEQCLDSQE